MGFVFLATARRRLSKSAAVEASCREPRPKDNMLWLGMVAVDNG